MVSLRDALSRQASTVCIKGKHFMIVFSNRSSGLTNPESTVNYVFSGAATTASRLGQPDLAIATLNDFVQVRGSIGKFYQ